MNGCGSILLGRRLIAAALAACALIGAAGTCEAQPKTLFDGDIASGGFGGVSLKATRVNNQLGVLVGGGGAWVLNHAFYIGGAGYGLVSDHAVQDLGLDTTGIGMGYGGLVIGAMLLPDELLHFGAQTLVGAGGIYRQHARRTFDFGFNNSDAIFVVEPSILAELNFTSKVRIAFEGSYRFVSGVEVAGLTNKELSGPAVGMMVKIGSF